MDFSFTKEKGVSLTWRDPRVQHESQCSCVGGGRQGPGRAQESRPRWLSHPFCLRPSPSALLASPLSTPHVEVLYLSVTFPNLWSLNIPVAFMSLCLCISSSLFLGNYSLVSSLIDSSLAFRMQPKHHYLSISQSYPSYCVRGCTLLPTLTFTAVSVTLHHNGWLPCPFPLMWGPRQCHFYF